MDKEKKIGLSIIAIIIIAWIAGSIVFRALPLLTQETVSVTVTEKERIRDGDNDKYLIWTEDEVFENTDEFLLGKFNSSDIYGNLKENETYECKVYGWRIPLFSTYRNIISCEEQGESND